MSRIGRMPVHIPAGVEVTIGEGNLVTVKGPKGSLTQQLYPTMTLTQEAGVVHVARPNDEKENRALHGLTRALLHNMVVGVTEGYTKSLELVGTGYRAQMQGKALNITIGFSHPVIVDAPENISLNYLAAMLMDVCGLEKTAAQKYQLELMRDYPVISSQCVMDAAGEISASYDYEQYPALTDYAKLQYNFLLDKRNRLESFWNLAGESAGD